MNETCRPNGLMVNCSQGERCRRLLVSLGLLDGSRRIIRRDGDLIFPLKQVDGDRLAGICPPGSQLVRCEFEPRPARPRSLQEALGAILSKDDISLMGRSYDVIGRILVIALPPPLLGRKHEIGEALLSWAPVETVAMKVSAISGERRLRGLEILAGKPSLETIHAENGLRFKLDLAKVFFNPRLAGERARVAGLAKDDDLVLDMFAGIGPFSISIAKSLRRDSARVYAVDKNDDAVRYLLENIRLNRAWKVSARQGNSRILVPQIAKEVGKFDRIIMNLPESSFEFLRSACAALKPGGHLHYYRLATRSAARRQIQDELGSVGRFALETIREVESYSPSKSIFVADAIMESS